MDEQLVQRTRYMLQTRFRRARTAKRGHFEKICQQVLSWVENHPILSSIIQKLDSIEGDHHKEIQMMLELEDRLLGRYYVLAIEKRDKTENDPDFKGYTATNFEQHASACLQVIRASIQRPYLNFYGILCEYLTQEKYGIQGNKISEAIDVLQDIALRDLYEYLDEHLDSINAVNGLLRKYKQNVEWFQRNKLREISSGYEGETGERALALHLQQYVFNQGVEFAVEPTSASGKVDLLLRDSTGKYVIIDAKYIKSGASRSEIIRKIAEGFNQVARYCNDYNQPEGFLTVFVDDDVSILIELEQANGFRYFKIGSSIIYFEDLNISDRASASKSGKVKQYTISAPELVEEIEELQG